MEFKHAFEEWDHSDQNLMHSTPGIVHEGILYQSENDENRFYLIGIWNNRENHQGLPSPSCATCTPPGSICSTPRSFPSTCKSSASDPTATASSCSSKR